MKDGNLADEVTVSSLPPWPAEPDGHGPTLMLRDPLSDNSLAENWTVSAGHGSPGHANEASLLSHPEKETIPRSSRLLQNYPNPFNACTSISFGLKQDCHVHLQIFDILGQGIKILIDREINNGMHRVNWDGRDNAGEIVAAGVYLLKIETADVTECVKMVLVR